MAKAFLLCGSTGAGKSTYAKVLSERESAQIFSIDEWMRILFWADVPAQDVYPWALERANRCEDLMLHMADRLLSENINVIFDVAFTTRRQRNKFYERLKCAGRSYQLLFVDVPVDIRLERVHRRNSEKSGTFQFEVTDEMFHWMEKIFEPPTDEELAAANGIKVF